MSTAKPKTRKLLKYFGNQTYLADVLGISQPAVSQWLAGKTQISEVMALKVHMLTDGEISAYDLRPGLLVEMREAKARLRKLKRKLAKEQAA